MPAVQRSFLADGVPKKSADYLYSRKGAKTPRMNIMNRSGVNKKLSLRLGDLVRDTWSQWFLTTK